MSLTQVPSNHHIPHSHNQDKENDPLQFSTELTHTKPQTLLLQNHPNHHSNYHSKNLPFQEIGNKTTPKQNHPKSTAQPIKLNELHVGPQYLRKPLSTQTQTPKEPLKVIVNQTSHEAHDHQTHDPQQQTAPKSLKSIKGKPKIKPLEIKQTDHQQVKETSNIFMANDETIQFQNPKKYQPLEMTKSDLLATPTIFQECSHVMKPIKKDYQIEHVFNRHNSCAFSDPVTYHLPTKNSQSVTSEKTNRFFNSEFQICLNKKGQQHPLGTLKSNFLGSIYNFYPLNSDAIYFSIVFKSQDHKVSQNFRYSEIYINKGLVQGDGNHHLIPYEKMESLEGLYLVNMGKKNKGQRTEIVKLSAKPPVWSSKQKCYGLKFPKKTWASSKNTILEDEDGKEVLKFYKNSYLTYNVTFENPISWIVAYCYGLASTDFKWFTE